MNHNDANFNQRCEFINTLLRERFDREDVDTKIIPINYELDWPFKYNNFLYRLELSSPILREHGEDTPLPPGCVAIPEGTTEFILRLANPDTDGMNTQNRVENEVATIHLVTTALNRFGLDVVPAVYDWASAAAESSQGWILQQLMPGVPLATEFDSLDLKEKKTLFAQMATMLKALQEFELPQSVTGFGGLTFDHAGNIVSAPMTTVDAGPWPSYEASFRGRLDVARQKADANPYIQGWRQNGIRDRLDAFIENGLPAQFQSLSSKMKKSIIHADFTTHNMLYDATSLRITALLDYDFSCVLHPSYEFFRSFDQGGGQFTGWCDSEASDQIALHDARLRGFPSPLPKSLDEGVQWDVAHAWELELEKQDVLRPRTIEGIDKVADVDAVLREILPWRLSNSDILRIQSENVKVLYTALCENRLLKMLDRLGY